MKRILLITLLVLSSAQGFSNSFLYLWGGAGLATHYNYDLGLSYGSTYVHGIFYRVAVGASVFTQQYNLYYNKEVSPISGASIRHNSNYAFFSPTIQFHMGDKVGATHFYVTGGVGFKISVTDTLHKWYKPAFPTTANLAYDSLIDKSANINSMVTRIAFGFTEHCFISKHIGMAFTEDFAFLPSLLSSTKDPGNTELNNNVNRLFRPTYISLRIAFYVR